MRDFERFVGVWELEGIEDEEKEEEEEEKIFLERKRGGVSRPRRPAVGFEHPAGLLIYLPSGVMSVNFAGASRLHFLREFSPTPPELASAGAAYGGYAGGWEVDEPQREVIHLPEVSFVPNRVGARIRRSYSFSEDVSLLFLRPVAIASGDPAPDRVLRWRRRPTP